MIAKLEAYAPSPETDVVLLRWWQRLIALDDLAKTFGQGAFTVSRFFDLFRPPSRLFFAAAPDVQVAFTVQPVLSGAFLGLWVAPEHRHSRSTVTCIEDFYEHLFECFPVLLGVTRQEKLLPAHAKWGYAVVGRIPHLFDQQEAWLVSLTQKDFITYKNRRHRWRQGRAA